MPHHHTNLVKDGDIEFHDKTSIWYVVDEMKTIEVFKKLGNVIVDRHPKVSECVYRRLEGGKSTLEYERSTFKDEVVILCHDSTSMAQRHDEVFKTYIEVLNILEISYGQFDTADGEVALDKIVEVLYQMTSRDR